MGCPPVRGDNPRALASGLSYVQVDKHGITNLYHLHQCRPCTSQEIRVKVGKGGINYAIQDLLALSLTDQTRLKRCSANPSPSKKS